MLQRLRIVELFCSSIITRVILSSYLHRGRVTRWNETRAAVRRLRVGTYESYYSHCVRDVDDCYNNDIAREKRERGKKKNANTHTMLFFLIFSFRSILVGRARDAARDRVLSG